MLANLDYTVVGSEEVQILECKTAGEFGSRLWRDGVPEYVQCQVQHQLAVTGKLAADVCVLICGQEIRIHRIERDDELIARLIELERQFWHYVETDTPPPADGSKSAGKALQYLYQQDSGDVLDFSDDPYLCQVFTDLLVAREEVSRAEQLEAERKSKNASTASGATKDGNKQIGVVRKKRSKEDDSEDDSLRKLKAGSALSSTKAQP
jgi:predicted phage-related endonuclease